MTSESKTGTPDAGRTARFSLRAATTLILAVLVSLVLLLFFLIAEGYRNTSERAFDRASAAALVVSDNARWITGAAEQALIRLDSALGPELDAVSAESVAALTEAVAGLPGSAKAYVVSVSGSTLFTTDPEIEPIDIRDREYFQAVQNGESFYVSGLLISRLNDQQIFAFSRRLDRNGEFAGAAIISFDVAMLSEIWNLVVNEAGSTISLVRDDGELVARYPLAETRLNVSDSPAFTELLPQSDTGTYEAVSRIDGLERYVAYRRVPGTELVAFATISLEQTLRQYWSNVAIVLLLTLPFMIGLAAAAIWIIRLLQREVERRDELSAALEANNLLFREIHHRVKNNLQSMQSLIRLQNLPAQVKADLHARFVAMAAVHDHMYRHDAYAELDAAEFVPEVVHPLLRSRGASARVDLQIEHMRISHDKATPLALLLTELVSNSLKHAGSDASAKITIRLNKTGDEGAATLEVADNGPGFDFETVEKGMGSRLIEGVVRQLEGEYSYSSDQGSRFSASLKVA